MIHQTLCHHEELSRLHPLHSRDGQHSFSICPMYISIGTDENHKVHKGTNLKKPPFPVTSSGQLGWSPPIRLVGLYQVARSGLITNYEQWFCNVDNTNYPKDLPMHRHNKCIDADKTCWKIIQVGDSIVTGWSSAIKTLGQDTMIGPPPSHDQL